jgi:hypothetical protein
LWPLSVVSIKRHYQMQMVNVYYLGAEMSRYPRIVVQHNQQCLLFQ